MTPDPNSVDNAIAELLVGYYDWMPLSVRYGAANAAREVVEQWQARQLCSCPCVDPGTHEYPAEYEPSETCPVHGAAESPFPAEKDSAGAYDEVSAHRLDRMGTVVVGTLMPYNESQGERVRDHEGTVWPVNADSVRKVPRV